MFCHVFSLPFEIFQLGYFNKPCKLMQRRMNLCIGTTKGGPWHFIQAFHEWVNRAQWGSGNKQMIKPTSESFGAG